MRKSLIAAAGAVLAVFVTAGVASAAPATISRNVNVYSQPDIASAPVGFAIAGTAGDASQCGGGWCYFTGGGLSGWVSAASLGGVGGGGPTPPGGGGGTPPTPPGGGGGTPPMPPGGGGGTPPTPPGGGGGTPPTPPGGGGGVTPPGGGGGMFPPPGPGPRPPMPPGGGGPGFSFDFNFGTPSRPPAQPRDGACFFERTNYRGNSFCIARGDSYDRLPRDWDNAVRSVRVYGRAEVEVCTDRNFRGRCGTLTRSTTALPERYDRSISSIDVY